VAASAGSGNRVQTAAVAVKAAIDDIDDDDTIIADRRSINGNMFSFVMILSLLLLLLLSLILLMLLSLSSLWHSPDVVVAIDRLLDEEKPQRRWVRGDTVTHAVVVDQEKTRDEVQVR